MLDNWNTPAELKALIWGEPEDFGHRDWFDRKFCVLDDGELAVRGDWNAFTWTEELGLPKTPSTTREDVLAAQEDYRARIPWNVKAEILKRVHAGERKRTVAEVFGIHPTTINYWLRQKAA